MFVAKKNNVSSSPANQASKKKNTFIQPKLKVVKPEQEKKTESIANKENIPPSSAPEKATFFAPVKPIKLIDKEESLSLEKEKNTASESKETESATILADNPTKEGTSTVNRKTNTTITTTPKLDVKNNIPVGKPIKKDNRETSVKEEREKSTQKIEAGTVIQQKEVTPTTPRNAQADPNFTQMQERLKSRARSQKTHESSKRASSKAQSAAVLPSNERASIAQATQVDTMEQQEAGTFNAVAFKKQLQQRINSMQLPENEKEAAKFDENNNIDEVRNAATQDVQHEKEGASGAIANTTAQRPNISAVEQRKSTPLVPAAIGRKPKSIGAQQAMPPVRGASEVSQPLQQQMGQLDSQMADNQITDEQLANSNEPSFTTALEAKNNADTHTQSAPQAFRGEEQGILQGAKTNAENRSGQALGGMHQQRAGLLQQVSGRQTQTSTQNTSERARIADAINGIYETTKTDVERILNTLDTRVATLFDQGVSRAKRAFEQFIKEKMDAYLDERYGGWGVFNRIKDAFVGLPDEVNKFFVEGREIFVARMDGVITEIANLVAVELTKAKKRITKGKQEVQTYVATLPRELQNIGKEAAKDIQDKFSELEQNVDSKQDELIDSLATKYNESLQAVDERIEEMKAANQGLVGLAMNAIGGVIRTIIQIKNMLTSLLSSALEVIGSIVRDPIGFLSLLIQGVGQGLRDFMANIGQHIQSGLIGWLTGSLGSAGITIPENLFSLSGIFSLVAQILGVTWDSIREKAVKVLGEPVVKIAETGVEIFQIIKQEGAGALWKYIKDQFVNLKEMVVDAIKDLIQTQVVQAGIKWILSLLTPAGAFVKAAMAIIDIVKFFIERGSQILEMVQGFINAVKAIASGSVGAVAAAIQNALKRALPVMIGFLASLLGISGLTQKITKIIRKVQAKINKAIMAVIMKVKKLVGKLLGKKKRGNKNTDKKVKQGKIEPEKFTMSGKRHTLSYENGTLMMQSVKRPIVTKLNILKREVSADVNDPKWKGNGKNIKTGAEGLSNAVKKTKDKLTKAKKAKNQKDINKGKQSLGLLADNISKFANKYRLKGFEDAAEVQADYKSEKVIVFFTVKKSFHNDKVAKRTKGKRAGGLKEYERQLVAQQKGINNLTIDKWRENRKKYLKAGRDAASAGEQERQRKELKAETVDRVWMEARQRGESMSLAQAEKIVEKEYVALHDPDQVAGGEADAITSLGRGDVNSSIGSQWKNKIHIVDAMVKKMFKKFNKQQRSKVKMNVELKTKLK